jgi:hypothetical protein
MHCSGALIASLAVALLTPAAASADPPWSPAATLAGARGGETSVVFTPAGHGVFAGSVARSIEPGTVLASVTPDGRLGRPQDVEVFAGRLAAYGADHVVLAGMRPALTAAAVQRAPIEVATGTPARGVGKPRALAGTAGQRLMAVAGSRSGTVALVTGTVAGHRRRFVWMGHGATIKRVLTITVGQRAQSAAVAVGAHGDVLVAWEDEHQIFSRQIDGSGHAGPTRRLGTGVQSAIQCRYDDGGRQEVAWESQRVGEGDAFSPATVWYTSAGRGRRFSKASVLGRADITGTGRYVQAPGVRLVGSGPDSSIVAFTVYDGTRFRVRVADTVAGRVQRAQTVSPADEDAVLADLAYARAGGTLVLWLSGTRGTDPSGPQRVFASTRPSGQATFTGPEAVTEPVDTSSPTARNATTVATAPSGAVDPQTGSAVAGFGFLAPRVAISARPPRSSSYVSLRQFHSRSQ